ncbi:unnamed protein product [Cuscuta campestris]|uniref:Uncharacterized protein n=1 Tax=Cuscuta campestris TaxID=132261 RepID=A0A484MVU0_9ASTE|nr:unnamed protein product [Cuscuta campestris]
MPPSDGKIFPSMGKQSPSETDFQNHAKQRWEVLPIAVKALVQHQHKAECPYPAMGGHTHGWNARHFKKQRAYISWGGDSGDESSEQEEDEEANLCLIAQEKEESANNENQEHLPEEVRRPGRRRPESCTSPRSRQGLFAIHSRNYEGEDEEDNSYAPSSSPDEADFEDAVDGDPMDVEDGEDDDEDADA